ncbi:HU family DNA-binding protein [Altericista sp. CCNU0014]
MNKGELADAIAIKANVTKREADAVSNATIDTVIDMVSK